MPKVGFAFPRRIFRGGDAGTASPSSDNAFPLAIFVEKNFFKSIMAKVDLDLLQFVLEKNSVDARLSAQILSDIQEQIKLEKMEAEEREPAVKKKYVFVASDPEGVLDGKELVGWVVQIPEDQSEFSVEERIFAATCEYNRSKKGHREPAKTVGEACERVPAKLFREQKIWVKNKEAAYLLPVSNALPSASEMRPQAE